MVFLVSSDGVPLFIIQTTEFVLKRPEKPNPVV